MSFACAASIMDSPTVTSTVFSEPSFSSKKVAVMLQWPHESVQHQGELVSHRMDALMIKSKECCIEIHTAQRHARS
jgi:hypothetical protein